MYSNHPRGPGRGTALLAVLQAILLLSALVLTPAAVIAQDAEPTVEPAATAEPATEPAAEPEPEPEAEPKAKAEPKANANAKAKAEPKAKTNAEPKAKANAEPKAKANAEPKAKTKPEKTLGEQGLAIQFFPQKVKAALGGKVVVSAYLCDENDDTPFGGPNAKGGPEDFCDPVSVDWKVKGDGATIASKSGKKTKVTLVDDSEPIRLIATVDDLKASSKIIVKEPKNDDADKGNKDPQPEPVVVEPVTDEPVADEPKDNGKGNDKPKNDNADKGNNGQGNKDPQPEPVVVEPVTDEPVADEPKDNGKGNDKPKNDNADKGNNGQGNKGPQPEPVVVEPVTDEPVADEPKDNGKGNDKPKNDDKGNNGQGNLDPQPEPVVDEPVADEPNDNGPGKGNDKPKNDDKGNNGQGNKDPQPEPVVDEPVADEPKNDDKGTDKSKNNGQSKNSPEGTVERIDEPKGKNNGPTGSAPVVESEPVIEAAPAEVSSAAVTKSVEPAVFEPAAAGDPGVGGSASLDQCANGGVGDPPTGCDGNNDWVNGNLGQSKASYAEGETIPYRMLLGGLTTTGEIHALTIEWDTTQQGLHALDYITSYDETEGSADPCAGAPCSGGSDDNIAIPADPQITGAGVTPIPGDFHIWGGSFDSISGYSYSGGTGYGGNKFASITVYFTATQADPVISWGGHIASRLDWGIGSSAGTINGSPYHMRLIGINGKGGNQDRSLSARSVYLLNLLRIIKDADPSDTGTSFDFTATGDFTPTPFSLQHAEQQDFGPYSQDSSGSVTEVGEPGWALTDIVCGVQDANGGSQNVDVAAGTVDISMNEGEIVTCTFYNEEQDGTLIVRKQVINDNGGTATAGQFAFNVAGPDAQGPIPFSQDAADPLFAENTLTVTSGAYTVTENEPILAGYSESYSNCTNVQVDAGETEICTITNDDDAAALFLAKTVVNDNGGTAVAADWTLSAGGNDVTGSPVAQLATDQTGTYDLSESGPSGYTNTSVTCDNGDGPDDVTLGLGESVICTFTNDDDAPSLTLVKVVVNDNGGTAVESDFTLTASGPTGFSGAGPSVSNGPSFDAGTYDLSESGPSGYAASDWVCVGGDQTDGDTIEIGLGESATCTITNDDNAPALYLRKVVVNDNGGTAVPSDWDLTAGATTVTGTDAAGGALATDQTGTYDLSESGPSGYTNTSVTCDNGDGPDDVTLGLGESVICTFTNDDDAPSLTLVKVVVNDNGGTAVESDFTLTASGPTGFSGAGPSVSNGPSFDAGTYDLSESGPSGYAASDWVCVGGDQTDGDTIEIGLGESATCTITNDDNAPALYLRKVVVNDNGGTAVPSDWDLTAGATTVTGTDAAGGALATDQTGTYDLSESGPSGYTNTSVTCDNGDGPDDVTLGLGESVICTFTNDDDAPSLTLVKVVVNDNGGTAVESDFTLTASGPTGFSGAGPSVSNGPSFDAGTYDLSESGPSGYAASDWVCVGGDQTDGDTIEIGLGESATCTITNDDNAPALYLRKVVVNDNGGTAVPSDWDLTAGATTVTGTDAAGGALATDQTGTYDLSESGPSGYTNTSVTCDNGDGPDDVTLGLGESVICTFTNDDDAPSLTLVKVVVNDNGGTAVESDFTLTASGPTGFSGAGPSVSNGPSFDAGTYDLSESGPSGYAASDWVCVGGDQTDGDTIEIGLGESATCTITNDDNAPALYLRKVVVNDNGGTAVPSDWDLTAGATTVTGTDAAGGALATDQTGTYDLSESGPSGYTNTSVTCDNGDGPDDVTLGLGESVICTFTNDDDAPSLTLVKVVVNDNGGTAVESDFTLTASGPTGFSGAGPSVSNGPSFDAGTYDLSESGPSGYAASDWVCVGGDQTDGDTIEIGLGESATCTITNDDNAPALYLRKVVVNDNGGTAVPSDWDLTAGATTVTGTDAAGGALATDQTGTYDLSESGPSGYTNTSVTCDNGDGPDDVTLGLGESVICTFTNDDIAPTLKLVKVVVNDDGGTAVANDWALFAAGDGGITENTPDAAEATFQDVNANVVYTLGEVGPDGYAAGDWVCTDGGTQVGGTIELALDEDVTCTITNDDIAPTLKLVKVVINDDGGTAVANDWALFAAGDGGITENTPDAAEATFQDVNANVVYTLGEVGPDGYAAGDWVCTDGGTQVGGTIELALDEDVTCTITNDDIAPTLKLVKVVINDDGGTAVADDWTLSAETTFDGFTDRNFSTLGGSGLFETVYAETVYALSESGPDGYTAGDWSCDGGDLQGDQLVLGVGETDITCTITNDDIAPTLKLVKIVDNGETDATFEADDWTLSATAAAPDDGRNFSDLGGSGIFETVFAETSYALSESGPDGYAAGDWSCDGGDLVGDALTLAAGETEVTCTITNTAIQPTLTLFKVVEGGTATVEDFQAQIDGADVDWTVTNDVTVGQRTASEIMNVDNYVATGWTGDCAADGTVTVELGNDYECTITNQYAELSIEKTSNFQSYSEVGDEVVYTIVATNTGVATLEGVVVSDPLIDGLADWQCSPSLPATLAQGESVTCTATYTITQADIDAGEVLNTACAESPDAVEVCDDNRIDLLSVTLTKSANPTTVFVPGEDVTFTLVYEHPVTEFDVYLYSLSDDIFGDLLDAGNPDVTDNTCAGAFGTLLAPNTEYTCEFTGFVAGEVGDLHLNEATVVITDVLTPGGVAPRFASASDTAVVDFLEPLTTPLPTPTPSPTLPPTDMLPTTDAFGSGNDSDPMSGLLNWAIWLMLSTLLIVGTGLIIRREKLAAVKNR